MEQIVDEEGIVGLTLSADLGHQYRVDVMRPDAEPEQVTTFRLEDGTIPASSAAALAGVDLGPPGPVFVELRRPREPLWAVEWERLLGPVLNRPVLRLAPYVLPPMRATSTLEVAVCGCAPLAEGAFPVDRLLFDAVTAALAIPDRTVRVHLFASPQDGHRVAAAVADPRLEVHDPGGSAPFGNARRSPSADRDGPWLAWMCEALRGRPIDALHFVTPGWMTGGVGAATFAESPLQNADPNWSLLVGAGPLTRFANGLGAWSIGFTSPPAGDRAALRHLLGELADARPGVAWLAEDAGHELGAVWAALFARGRVPMPRTEHVAVYCAPALLYRWEDDRVHAAIGSMRGAWKSVRPPERGLRWSADRPLSAWQQSAQRLLEQSAPFVAMEPVNEEERASQDGARAAMELVAKLIEEDPT